MSNCRSLCGFSVNLLHSGFLVEEYTIENTPTIHNGYMKLVGSERIFRSETIIARNARGVKCESEKKDDRYIATKYRYVPVGYCQLSCWFKKQIFIFGKCCVKHNAEYSASNNFSNSDSKHHKWNREINSISRSKDEWNN